MIPEAALTLLNETINSTISASQSQSLSESEPNAGEIGFGPSGNEVIIAISSLVAVMLVTGYCFYKSIKPQLATSQDTTATTTPLLSRSSINSDPEEGLTCTDNMAIGCNTFWSKMGF